MAWIELHQAVWTHRKTFELASRLDLDETYAAAHVIRLWTWALDNAPEGILAGLSDRAIAFGAGWRGDVKAFVEALVGAGWLDEDRKIHDWDEYALKLIERKRANAERMRAARAANVHNTVRERVGLPDRTGPDLTQPDRNLPPNPPPQAEGGLAPPRRRRRRDEQAEEIIAPTTPGDEALWQQAADLAAGFMKPALFDGLVRPLVPIGRAPDGGLRLRAPPNVAADAQRMVSHVVTRVLQEVGDADGNRAAIVGG